MKSEIKALVVEDDLDIQEEIESALVVLDHEHVWAESQQEAREALEKTHFHYALVDLEIPARTGRGFAKIEYGKKLIDQIQQIKGRGVLPVIVMTGHHKHGLNLVRELLGNGAMDFISKPFGDGTEGKSLPQVIQGVLDQHRRSFPPGTLPGDPPRKFEGGVLAFYPDHIELEGAMIIERGCPGHAWEVMQILRTPRSGRMPKLSAPRLAKAIDPSGQLSDGAINSCIHTLRARITETMLAGDNLTVSRDDVIANQGKGYHVAEWLVIESHDAEPTGQEPLAPPASHEPRVTAKSPKSDSNEQNPLTDRQHWILDQLRDNAKLTRDLVERQFGIKDKQAKRELAGLSRRGLIRFIRKPRPGYYVLRRKPSAKTSK